MVYKGRLVEFSKKIGQKAIKILKRLRDDSSLPNHTSLIQGSTNRRALGLVNFVLALAYHFCLNLPAAFTQPGALGGNLIGYFRPPKDGRPPKVG